MDELNQLRNEIDSTDQKIVDLLVQRTKIVRLIGQNKAANKIQPLAQSRWEEVLKGVLIRTEQEGGNIDLVREIYEIIHKHSLIEESKIAKNKNNSDE
jgi:chorismate mutase